MHRLTSSISRVGVSGLGKASCTIRSQESFTDERRSGDPTNDTDVAAAVIWQVMPDVPTISGK